MTKDGSKTKGLGLGKAEQQTVHTNTIQRTEKIIIIIKKEKKTELKIRIRYENSW